MSVGDSFISASKGKKEKQAKAGSSKGQDAKSPSLLRKSTRLNSGGASASKRVRTDSSQPEPIAESLVRRLASQFTAIAKTYEEIAEQMRA